MQSFCYSGVMRQGLKSLPLSPYRDRVQNVDAYLDVLVSFPMAQQLLVGQRLLIIET